MKDFISDESLNAFIDGEFDVTESEALMARMRDDADLAQRVATLRSLQSMVRVAYAKPPRTRNWRTTVAPKAHFVQRCAFGCLILAVGVSSGWLLHSLETRHAGPAPALSAGPAQTVGGYQPVTLTREADPDKILLHIDSGDAAKMRMVLDQAEIFLDQANKQGRVIQLEIIANSNGLTLMRNGLSPYSERIARMKQRHANLGFVACGQAIARFEEKGQRVDLLPAVQRAPTAIGEIVTRLQQGWTYVRV